MHKFLSKKNQFRNIRKIAEEAEEDGMAFGGSLENGKIINKRNEKVLVKEINKIIKKNHSKLINTRKLLKND